MTTIQICNLVQQMRDMQQDYFKTKSRVSLLEAKRLEKEVDRLVRNLLNPEPPNLLTMLLDEAQNDRQRCRYLIHVDDASPFYRNWHTPELHVGTVYDLTKGTYSDNGIDWYTIEEDTL